MKVILKSGNSAVVRFDKGEEVFAGLSEFAKTENVQAGFFTGLGTCSEIEIGYYNEHLKDYRRKPFVEGLEILSLTGNLSMLDGAPAIHAHGIFGRTDFTLFGGHIFKLVTLATCEIHFTILEGQMGRAANADFNLNLLA